MEHGEGDTRYSSREVYGCLLILLPTHHGVVRRVTRNARYDEVMIPSTIAPKQVRDFAITTVVVIRLCRRRKEGTW